MFNGMPKKNRLQIGLISSYGYVLIEKKYNRTSFKNLWWPTVFDNFFSHLPKLDIIQDQSFPIFLSGRKILYKNVCPAFFLKSAIFAYKMFHKTYLSIWEHFQSSLKNVWKIIINLSL